MKLRELRRVSVSIGEFWRVWEILGKLVEFWTSLGEARKALG